MRHIVLAALAGLGIALPALTAAFAQTSEPNTASPPPASPFSSPAATATPTQPQAKVVVPPDDQLEIKNVRQTCRDYAQSQNLTGDAMQTAISTCVTKFRPDLSGKE